LEKWPVKEKTVVQLLAYYSYRPMGKLNIGLPKRLSSFNQFNPSLFQKLRHTKLLYGWYR